MAKKIYKPFIFKAYPRLNDLKTRFLKKLSTLSTHLSTFFAYKLGIKKWRTYAVFIGLQNFGAIFRYFIHLFLWKNEDNIDN